MKEMEETLSKNEQERQERLSAAKGRKVKRLITWLIVLVIIGVGIYLLTLNTQRAQEDQPGEAVPVLENITHIAPGGEHEPYNSNPPTSGQHWASPANWGFYEQPLPDEQIVHNLEHGGVWISYQNPEDEQLKSQLRELSQEYTLKVIITPRPENDAPIALAAWGRLLKFQTFDRDQIVDFIKAFINRGPEQTPF